MTAFDALLDDIQAHRGGLTKSVPPARRISAVDPDLLDVFIEEFEDFHPGKLVPVLRKMAAVIVAQGRAINALRADLDAGRGGPLTKALSLRGAKGLDGETFLAKALTAQGAGRITGLQVSIAEAHINGGSQPPPEIVRAVLEHT